MKTFTASVHVTAFMTVEVEAASKAEAERKAMDKANWQSRELQNYTITPDAVESIWTKEP